MGKNRLPTNSVLKGQYRTFNLAKCEVDGCNNFITSLDFKCPSICRSHKNKTGQRKGKAKNKIRKSTIIKKHQYYGLSKLKTPDMRVRI
jgi:hypothetical protein